MSSKGCMDCHKPVSGNKKRCSECQKAKQREYNRSYNKEHHSYNIIRVQNARAEASGIEGRLTCEEWSALCLKYDNRCLRCGISDQLTPDHIIPLSQGGLNVIENIQPLCRSCNCSKHDKAMDYRVEPEEVRRGRWKRQEAHRERFKLYADRYMGWIHPDTSLPDIFDEDAYWDFLFSHDEFSGC